MIARLQVPRQARRGEILEIRIAIQHRMETGFRFDDFGKTIPKNVIHTLRCRFDGIEVFRAEMGSGIAANPYLEFCMLAEASGELVLDWVDDAGLTGTERVPITVSE